MSTAEVSIGVVIQKIADFVAYNNVAVASLALLAYDTILTFPLEVEFVWQKKFRLAAFLYTITRYPTILYFAVYFILNTFPFTLEVTTQLLDSVLPVTCTRLEHFLDVLTLLPILGIQGMLIARTYSISQRNRWILAVLSLLLLVSLIPNIMGVAADNCALTTAQMKKYEFMNMAGCLYNNDLNRHSETIIGGFALLASDTIVIAVTVYHTIGFVKMSKGVMKESLTLLFLRQGVLRYLFVLIITLTGMILVLTLRTSVAPILSPIQAAISAILICRFLLEIRLRNDRANNGGSLSLPIGSFRAAVQQIEDLVVEEFGDRAFNSGEYRHDTREDDQSPDWPDQSPISEPGDNISGTPHTSPVGNIREAHSDVLHASGMV